MPSVSKKQQRLMGADLARARAGKKTRTGMSKKQLEEYASTPRKGLPAKKSKPKEATHKMPASHAHMTPKTHKRAMANMARKRKGKK